MITCSVCGKPATGHINIMASVASSVPSEMDPRCVDHMNSDPTPEAPPAAPERDDDDEEFASDVDLIRTAIAVTLRDEMGEAIHTALRKADITSGYAVWQAIRFMPEGEWAKAVEFARWGLINSIDRAITEAPAAPEPRRFGRVPVENGKVLYPTDDDDDAVRDSGVDPRLLNPPACVVVPEPAAPEPREAE